VRIHQWRETATQEGLSSILPWYCSPSGTAVAQWLRRCATNPKVAGSNPVGVIGISH